MTRHEFCVAVRLWLGITLSPLHPSAVSCKCGQLIDSFGDHLGCHQTNLWSKCHNTLRDVIFNALLMTKALQRSEDSRRTPVIALETSSTSIF